MQLAKCFKAYDIRGKVPEELNERAAYAIGVAYAQFIKPKKVILGYDVRLESKMLFNALAAGLNHAKVEVIDIGLCGTEEVYFHTFNRKQQGVDGGIMITASHNPKGYNGMKMVRGESRPISQDTGLIEIQHLASSIEVPAQIPAPTLVIQDYDKSAYIKHLLGYTDIANLKPLKIVVNPGNGTAGPVLKLLEQHLPLKFIYLQDKPDGNFPNGVPNPLLIENRAITANAVKEHNADLGIAWDGDFDRCFFFDQNGKFIEGYYIVGLLAEAFLNKFKGEKIVHDPRLTWNTLDIVNRKNGAAVQSKSGHAFIKEQMRKENAIYGGEMSAHHYFRDFAYCDSGMIPWLLVCELISRSGKNLAEMVEERIELFPCSGEINFEVSNSKEVIKTILDEFSEGATKIDHTDGVSVEFPNWRCNVRASNTEPLLRLNIETKSDKKLLETITKKLSSFIK